MTLRIEDYALIGDTHTAALVGCDGALAWLSLPRFDSNAPFAALLGTRENGHWTIAPAQAAQRVRRRYEEDTLVLETTFESAGGCVRVLDCMPLDGAHRRVIRHVHGEAGSVDMRMTFAPKFDYGEMTPWIVLDGRSAQAVCGPDALHLQAPCALQRDGGTVFADFTVRRGDVARFAVTSYASHERRPENCDGDAELAATRRWWRDYVAKSTYAGPYRDAVVRSLITLKALTYSPTGAIVAAPTTSLPEFIGGVRNWDYRYCWLRDATFTLIALLSAGCHGEAQSFVQWLIRAIAGEPEKMRILYGVAGERRLPEHELRFLPGYENSRPVRVGNGAATQFQLDVYGEVVDAVYHATKAGLELHPAAWHMLTGIVDCVIEHENDGDHGIWEVRGPRRHFTHSKVMAWVTFDRAVKLVEEHGFEAPVAMYREHRDRLHAEILKRGFDAKRGTFVQSYGSQALDASLLLVPLVGFLPPDDARVASTIAAIEADLLATPFLRRYDTAAASNPDGLPPGDGAFLACSFWLADNYVLAGRDDEARALFEQLLELRNDVGLLSEEYDPQARRFLGNMPQALSHLALVNTALNLERADGPARQRASRRSAHTLKSPSANK
ncbi:MAG: glycoside hydrolase family 15 protein [Candidatus Velthaea sp.]